LQPLRYGGDRSGGRLGATASATAGVGGSVSTSAGVGASVGGSASAGGSASVGVGGAEESGAASGSETPVTPQSSNTSSRDSNS
jgi:hypothetical protein